MKIKLSKNQWEEAGKKAGWIKKSQSTSSNLMPEEIKDLINEYILLHKNVIKMDVWNDILSTYIVIKKTGDEESWSTDYTFTINDKNLLKYMKQFEINGRDEYGQRDNSGEIIGGVFYSRSYYELIGNKIVVHSSGGYNI
jgi:hypothetical protein